MFNEDRWSSPGVHKNACTVVSPLHRKIFIKSPETGEPNICPLPRSSSKRLGQRVGGTY